MAIRHITSSRAQRQNVNGYTLCFGVKLSSGGTSGFVGRRCVLEIQDDSQITGSTNNYAGFTDTLVVPKNTGVYGYVRTSKCPALMADATSCRKSKMAAN